MAKKKLNAFSADEADDTFTPSVKTIKGAPVEETPAEEAPPKRTQQPVKKAAEPKKEAKKPDPVKEAPVEAAKPKEVAPPAPKPEPPVAQRDQAINEAISANTQTTAVAKAGDDDTSELIQLVGFCLGDEEFGVNINEVHEINRTMDITPVPRTPDFVEGVINLRGKVIPVINMRTRFRLPPEEKTSHTRIVIVEVDGKIVGMLVDSVTEVLRISSQTIEPPPDILSGIDSENIYGVAKLEDRLLILLDLSKVLSNVDSRKGETA